MAVFGEKEEDRSLDPKEPILSYLRGPNSIPWHPGTMKAPWIYKICFLGSVGTGKSSMCNRLVARTFDPSYRPSRAPAQLFWRTTEAATGKDLMFEIEDYPGVSQETSVSGELSSQAKKEITTMLYPLCWFEKRREDIEGKSRFETAAAEANPLLPGGAPKISKSSNRRSGGLANLRAAASGFASGLASLTAEAMGMGEPEQTNPIGVDRKRMGFVIVADVSSDASFRAAYAIVDRLFDRLQYDVNDPVACPVSVVIAGNKGDLRGNRREAPAEEDIRNDVRSRYMNPKGLPSVEYIECSAATNEGLEEVLFESLARIRQLPARMRIRTARLRAFGYCARFKRECFSCFPCCFEVEEFFKFLNRDVIKPCVRKLGLYSLCCECVPLVYLRQLLRAWIQRFLKFRWLCSWCPPFILRLRKDVDESEEDADLEGGKGGDDGDDDPPDPDK